MVQRVTHDTLITVVRHRFIGVVYTALSNVVHEPFRVLYTYIVQEM